MNHEPLHTHDDAHDHIDERSPDLLYDAEDLRRLRALALYRLEGYRAVLDQFRHCRRLAIGLNPTALVRSLSEVEAYAHEAVEEATRKVAEFDKDLANATPASRWQMVLRPTAPR